LFALALVAGACGGDAGPPAKSGAAVTLDMQMVMFGAVPADTNAAQHLVVSSTGTHALEIDSLAITDDTRHAFATGGLPVKINAGASATLDLTYTAAGAPTSDTGTLVLATNADDQPILNVPLFGTTVAGPVPITVTLAGDGGGSVSSSPLGINCGTACTADFSPGTMVTLSAFANNGSAFTGFSGACTGMTCTIDVTAAANVTATFVKTYTLSVSSSGSGDGTVTGGGINCTITAGVGSGACATTVPEGTVVPLTATPASGSRFGAWGGVCSGASCSPAVAADDNVAVSFVLQHTVTVTLAGDGGGTVMSSPAGLSCAPTCSFDFDHGSMPVFTAMADGTSSFTGFSVDCSGQSCTPTVNGPLAITATFVKLQTLTVTATGNGSGTVTGNGISCTITGGVTSGTCSAPVAEGTSVNLSATITGNTRFGGFSNACSGSSCSFTMPAGNATANAQFVKQYTVSVTVGGSGTGTVTSTPSAISCPGTCSASFDELTSVSLSAAPNGGATYAYSVDCSGTSCSFASLSQNESVTATFTAAAYSIGGTVTGLGSGLTLSNNGTPLAITSNGTFAFTNQPAGYSISVSTQPTMPPQNCSVTNGTGTASSDVTNIQVDCPPATISPGLVHPNTLTKRNSTLYFATGIDNCSTSTGAGDAVYLMNLGSGPTKIDDVEHSAGNCGLYGLVFDSTSVYWVNYATGHIKKAPLAGGTVTTVYNAPVYTNFLQIDPAAGYLYFFGFTQGQITKVSTAGTGATAFATGLPTNGLNGTTDASYLYWTDYNNGTVNKLAFSTSSLPGTPTQIVTGETGIAGPFVTATTIYWITLAATGAVRDALLSTVGGSGTALYSSIPQANAQVVDANYAYVVSQGTAGNNYTDGAIYKIPLAGGSPIIIAKNLNNPRSLVQDPNKLWFAIDNTPGNSDGAIVQLSK